MSGHLERVGVYSEFTREASVSGRQIAEALDDRIH